MLQALLNGLRHWACLRERDRLREWLGLALWQRVPLEQRLCDSSAPISHIAEQVFAAENAASVADALAQLSENNAQEPAEQPAHTAALLPLVLTRLQHLRARLGAQPMPASGLDLNDKSGAAIPPASAAQIRADAKLMCKKMRRETQLLRFPFYQLSRAVPLLTAFFFLSSYLIVAFYLAHFGIRASRFFSLWDYLSSSMDALRGVGISLAISSVFLLYVFRRLKLDMLRRQLNMRIATRVLEWFGMMGSSVLTGIALWLQHPAANALLGFTCVYFIATLSVRISFRFRYPIRSIFFLSFSALYSVNVTTIVLGSIQFVSSPFDRENEVLYQLRRVDESSASGPFRLLMGNSQWLFLQDPQLQVHVVQIQQVHELLPHLPKPAPVPIPPSQAAAVPAAAEQNTTPMPQPTNP